MPHLTKEQLNQVKYVSLEDYCTRVDQIEELEDKLAFTTRYILTHGQGNANPDHPIEDVIKVAHMKIAEKSADLKEFYQETEANRGRADGMVNPTVQVYENDLGNQMFIANPVGYLKGQAKAAAAELKAKKWKEEEDIQAMINLNHLENEVFTNQFATKMSEAVKKPAAFDINFRMQRAFGGERAFKKAVDDTKPGILSRMFGTRSLAAANLDSAWKAFNNPNHVLNGDLPTIQDAATKYLQHVLPDWKPDRLKNIPTAADIARLSGTKKARAEFSINILKSVKEQKDMEVGYSEMVEACQEKNLAFENIPGQPEAANPVRENAAPFQQEVEHDMGEEENNNLINQDNEVQEEQANLDKDEFELE